jgi:hypothetical protein
LLLQEERVQPADIAVELRPRRAWEAMDLGLAMLQRWWRAVLLPHAMVLCLVVAAASALGASLGKPWLAVLLVWWLKPLYDRVILHVLSRAVFGELQSTRTVLGAWREWLGSGLFVYLLLRWWPDMARSFDLPVRQLEGSRGKDARERLSVLGRRTRGSAWWLTVVLIHFEFVLYWSLLLIATLVLPAKAYETRGFFDAFAGGGASSWPHVAAYALTVLVIEPFYVAGGFALYLNRRTVLEGWDLEVALRRLAKRHAALAAAVLVALACVFAPEPAHAQKDPRKEIAEVLKAPEFPHERDTMRWQPRRRDASLRQSGGDTWFNFGGALAELVRVVLWGAIAVGIGFLVWYVVRALPRFSGPPAGEAYRPPKTLFGMELAPESLPADVAAAARALASERRMREALALLYRGALSQLVHRRGVQLLASHTEIEVLRRAPAETLQYLGALVAAWRACAYANRPPTAAELEQLAAGYGGL